MVRLIRSISFALVVCMLVALLPANVFAENQEQQIMQEKTQDTPSGEKNVVQKKKEAKIIGEDVSKRKKNIKHFLKDDMTFEAVIYPFAVHYEDNGEWKDIDNTLFETVDEDKNEVLKNKSNDFQVKVSKKVNSKKNGNNNKKRLSVIVGSA